MRYWIVTPRQADSPSHWFSGVNTTYYTKNGKRRTDAYLHVCPNPAEEYTDIVDVPDSRVADFEAFLEEITAAGVEVIVLGRSE